MTTLQTTRLTLRPLRMDDADDITRLLQEKRVVEMMSVIPWPYERRHAVEWLERLAANKEDDRNECFAITLRESAEFLGVIGLHPDPSAPWAFFGYWLGIDHWGHGYMTEALREILRFGFAELGLRRIEACHFLHNPASGRVMRKAGLRFEGVQRLRVRRGDQLFDRVNYGLIDDDWRALEDARPAE